MDLRATAGIFLTDAEDLEYLPNGGAARPIRGLVDRQQPGTLDNVPAWAAKCTVTVRCDADEGITAAELDLARDRIMVAVRYGGTPEPRALGKILTQDAGLLTLEVC